MTFVEEIRELCHTTFEAIEWCEPNLNQNDIIVYKLMRLGFDFIEFIGDDCYDYCNLYDYNDVREKVVFKDVKKMKDYNFFIISSCAAHNINNYLDELIIYNQHFDLHILCIHKSRNIKQECPNFKEEEEY